MSHAHSHDTGHGGHGGYEPSDANLRGVVRFLVIMFVVTGLVLFALYGLMNAYKKMPQPNSDVVPHPLAVERQIPAEPRLEALRGIVKGVDGHMSSEPYFNRKMVKQWSAEWKEELSTYAYVDPALGIARIPIERAMELKLEKGFPTAKPRN